MVTTTRTTTTTTPTEVTAQVQRMDGWMDGGWMFRMANTLARHKRTTAVRTHGAAHRALPSCEVVHVQCTSSAAWQHNVEEDGGRTDCGNEVLTYIYCVVSSRP